MKKYFIHIFVIILHSICFAQQIKPSVSDNGGGLAEGDEVKLLSSIGQSVTGFYSDSIMLEIGFVNLETMSSEIFEENNYPKDFSIGEFYPNPFNSTTKIDLKISRKETVILEIFDISGKRIFSWAKTLEIGEYSVAFSPSDKLNSGIYPYRISNTKQITKNGNIIYTK